MGGTVQCSAANKCGHTRTSGLDYLPDFSYWSSHLPGLQCIKPKMCMQCTFDLSINWSRIKMQRETQIIQTLWFVTWKRCLSVKWEWGKKKRQTNCWEEFLSWKQAPKRTAILRHSLMAQGSISADAFCEASYSVLTDSTATSLTKATCQNASLIQIKIQETH